MGKRGPACSVCTHPDRLEIEKYYRPVNGKTFKLEWIASKFGLGKTAVENHRRKHWRPKTAFGKVVDFPSRNDLPGNDPGEQVKPPEPMRKRLPSDASQKDRARADCDWLEARIEWGQVTGEDARELAALQGQLLQMRKLWARLSGDLEITEAQICRSAPWLRLMSLIEGALVKHPAALREVSAVLAKYNEGKS